MTMRRSFHDTVEPVHEAWLADENGLTKRRVRVCAEVWLGAKARVPDLAVYDQAGRMLGRVAVDHFSGAPHGDVRLVVWVGKQEEASVVVPLRPTEEDDLGPGDPTYVSDGGVL